MNFANWLVDKDWWIIRDKDGSFAVRNMNSFSDESEDERILDIHLRYVKTKELRLENVKDAILMYDFCKKYNLYLTKDCINYLQTNLCVENVLEIYEGADKLKKYPELTKICWKYISKNTSEILEHHSFITARFETVLDIISSDFLALHSELEVYNAVVKWGKENFKESNPQTFRELIFPLLKEVRFVSMNYFEFSGSPCIDGLLTKDEQLEIYRIKANPMVKRGKKSVIEDNWKRERRFEFLSSCYLSSECKNHLHREKSRKNFLNIKGDFRSKVENLKVCGVTIQVNVKLHNNNNNNNNKLNVDISLELIINNITNSDIKIGYDEVSLRENNNFSETEEITIFLNEPVIINKNDFFTIHVYSLHTDTDIAEFIYCTNDAVTYNEFETLEYKGDDYDYDDKPHFVSIIATYND